MSDQVSLNPDFIYKTKIKEKDLDTLGYHFKLINEDIPYVPIYTWSDRQIKEFEQRITTLQFNGYLRLQFDLFQYSKQGSIEDRLPKLFQVLQNQNVGIYNFISYTYGDGVIDNLVIEGNPVIISKIKEALIKRLRNGNTSDFRQIAPIMHNDSSTAYYKTLLSIKENIVDNDFILFNFNV